jgi:hypothetical protein
MSFADSVSSAVSLLAETKISDGFVASIFILPHTSHLLQPLDVACFGPVQQFMP